MRRLAGGFGAVLVAACLLPATANAGFVHVTLAEGAFKGPPESAWYIDQLIENNDVTVTSYDTAVTFVERGAALLLPGVVNGADLTNPLRFVQVCTLGLNTATCKVAPGGMAAPFVDAGLGDDRVQAYIGTATAASPALLGNNGNDTLIGSSAADTLEGGLGNDVIDGGAGDDAIDMNRNDFLPDGTDTVRSGDGNDRIVSRDAVRDQVDCGNGVDLVIADALDVVAANCENVVLS